MKLYIKYLANVFKKNVLLFFLISIVTSFLMIATFLIPLINGKFVDDVLVAHEINLFIPLILTLILLETFNFIANLFLEVVLNKLRFNIVKKEKINFIKNMHEINKFNNNIPQSELQTRFGEIDELCNIITYQHFKLISSIIVASLSFIIILNVNLKLALILIILIPLLSWTNIVLISKLKKYSQHVFVENVNLQSSFTDYVENISLFRRNRILHEREKKINLEAFSYINSQVKFNNRISLTTLFVAYSNNAKNALLMACVGYLVLDGQLTIGQYYALIQYINYFYQPIFIIPTVFVTITNTITSLNRYKNFTKKFQIKNNNNNFIKVKEIALNEPLYNNRINFKVKCLLKRNQIYLLEHSNGMGKSTLLNLIMLFDVPTSGNIMINSVDSKLLTNQKIDVFYASQQSEVFNGTIRDNILLNNKITDAELDTMIKKYDLQLELEGIDLDKKIYNRNISHGEMKTIEIMRLLITESNFIILDELFASLDHEKKIDVLKIIERKKKDAIIIVVDHEKFLKKSNSDIHII